MEKICPYISLGTVINEGYGAPVVSYDEELDEELFTFEKESTIESNMLMYCMKEKCAAYVCGRCRYGR